MENSLDWDISSAIKKAREARGLTQAELGEMIGLEPTSISKIECRHSKPSIASLRAIVIALKTSADDLLGTTQLLLSTDTLKLIRQIDELQESLSICKEELKSLKDEDIEK